MGVMSRKGVGKGGSEERSGLETRGGRIRGTLIWLSRESRSRRGDERCEQREKRRDAEEGWGWERMERKGGGEGGGGERRGRINIC